MVESDGDASSLRRKPPVRGNHLHPTGNGPLSEDMKKSRPRTDVSLLSPHPLLWPERQIFAETERCIPGSLLSLVFFVKDSENQRGGFRPSKHRELLMKNL